MVDTIKHGLAGDSAALVQARYDALLGSPGRLTLYHTVFLGVTALVVARGIAGGIERAALYLMPILIILIILLAIYSVLKGEARAALRFLVAFDAGRL